MVLPVKWSVLYSACSFPKWVGFVLCCEMFARLQKAHFIRKPPRGVWQSDFKWNNTTACFTVRSCSNKKSGRVFIYLHRWHYKAMLWGGCVFFLFVSNTVCCGMAGLDTMRNKKKKSFQKRANSVFVWPNSLSLGGPSHGNKALCPFSRRPPLLHTHLSTSFTQLLSVIAFTLVILLVMSFLGIRCNFMLQDSVCDDLCGS